ncbi:MAG: hypothetical protein HY067_09455 [Betaproteobacteria bacterium]|nr:hypothetical protein [Betaproteobacteria bacterium]
MRMEAHIHGTVLLRAGTTTTQIEEALRPWLEYIDEDNMADAKSVHPDEPGLVFDRRRRVLEVCWTGDVGRSFHQTIAGALAALSPFSEEAAAFEVSYYLEDGKDEFSLVFVGPTQDAIFEAQRGLMIEDVRSLLSRQFSDPEIAQVVALVNQLFERNVKSGTSNTQTSTGPSEPMPMPAGRKHLH